MGCRSDYVGSTSGVPEIATDLLRRRSRQPWAIRRHSAVVALPLRTKVSTPSAGARKGGGSRLPAGELTSAKRVPAFAPVVASALRRRQRNLRAVVAQCNRDRDRRCGGARLSTGGDCQTVQLDHASSDRDSLERGSKCRVSVAGPCRVPLSYCGRRAPRTDRWRSDAVQPRPGRDRRER
jgi:hypothetical protein